LQTSASGLLNVNQSAADEVFKQTWKNIKISRPVRLSEIKDFDELDMSLY
jgi:hypothetical protein